MSDIPTGKRVKKRKGKKKPQRRHSVDTVNVPAPVTSAKSKEIKKSWDNFEKNQEIRSYLSLARNIASSPVKPASKISVSPAKSPTIKPKASKGPLPYAETVLTSFNKTPKTSPQKSIIPNGKSNSSPHTPKLGPQLVTRHSAPTIGGSKSAPNSAHKPSRSLSGSFQSTLKLDEKNRDSKSQGTPSPMRLNRTRSDTTGMEKIAAESKIRNKTRTASTPTRPSNSTESSLRIPKSSPVRVPSTAKEFSKLHDEMIDVCSFFDRGRKERYERRIQVTKRISEIIYELWPDVEVSLIGSTATGLFLYDSDIDLVVRNPDQAENLTVQDLINLGRVLEETKTVRNIQVIATAMLPIIKMEDKYSPFTVDITFNVTTGLYSTVLVQDFVDKYESLKPLLLVLKQLLKIRGLNELYRGGLPSFTLTIMIVSFLQFFDDKSDSEAKFAENFDHDYDAELRRFEYGLEMDRTAALGSEDEHSDDDHFVDTTRTRQNYDFDLGQHLLGFLELYGCTFDYRQLGISIVNEGGYFPKKSRGWLYKHNPDLLCVEHPQDRNYDLGFKIYNIEMIRSCFSTIHNLLKAGSPLHEILCLPMQPR